MLTFIHAKYTQRAALCACKLRIPTSKARLSEPDNWKAKSEREKES